MLVLRIFLPHTFCILASHLKLMGVGLCACTLCTVLACTQHIYKWEHTRIQTGLMWTILSIDLWCLPIIFDTAIRTRLLHHIIIGIRRWVCVYQIIKRMYLGARIISTNTNTILTRSCSNLAGFLLGIALGAWNPIILLHFRTHTHTLEHTHTQSQCAMSFVYIYSVLIGINRNHFLSRAMASFSW